MVHANFPFDEPLVPTIDRDDLFSFGRIEGGDVLPGIIRSDRSLSVQDADVLAQYLENHKVIVLAGEGTSRLQLYRIRRDAIERRKHFLRSANASMHRF